MAIKPLIFRNFSGGTNSRDGETELSPNEFPDSQNVTIDERGQARKRLGYLDRYGVQLAPSLVANTYYWPSQMKLVSQVGTGMYLDNGASFLTWSTPARVGMVEFGNNLFINHPADGLRFYNGATVTSVPTAPKGNTLAVWQNRLWSNDSSVNSRLWYSPIGDPTAAWPVTNWVDLKEKDSGAITCLAGASGQDIQGRPGLLVFKQDSSYRVYDSNTGAYSTIDTSIGCGSNIGAISAYGRTFVASTRGIYSTDGLEPMREDSMLIEPFFEKTQINQDRPDLYCAGRYQDRLYFSFPRAGATANGVEVELHPIQHWAVRHTSAASCYASIGQNATDLVFGSPSVNGRVYNSHKGGSDNGADITSYLRTNWQEPNNGDKFRLRRLRVTGMGSFSLTPLRDYETTGSLASRNVSLISNAAVWDSGALWDDPTVLWGPTKFETHQDLWSMGVFRSLAFRIDETSSLVSSGPQVMGGTNTPERGAWELSHMVGQAFDLGTY